MDFVTILSLLFGDGEETERKLRSSNCATLEKLSALAPERLCDITGLSLRHSECMIDYAARMLEEEKVRGAASRSPVRSRRMKHLSPQPALRQTSAREKRAESPQDLKSFWRFG